MVLGSNMLCKQYMNRSKRWIYLQAVLTVVATVLLNQSLVSGQSQSSGHNHIPHPESTPAIQEYAAQEQAWQDYSSQDYSQGHSQEYSAPIQHEYVDQGFSPSYGPSIQAGASAPEHSKLYCGVDQFSDPGCTGGPSWRKQQLIPFESYGAGEYIGPSRTPHVNAYRLRVDDQIEFVFQITRQSFGKGYQLSSGDVIRITSPVDERLNEAARLDGITIMPDNTVSLDLIGTVIAGGKTVEALKAELDSLYSRFYDTKPNVVVSGVQTGTKLRDFLDSVDARAGSGGQARQVTVSPDGTVRLPLVGTVGVVGLTLDELEREINMRYGQQLQGLHVTPILTRRVPRFIYVAGEVAQPGRFELFAPTSAMQAIALAGSWNNGGNTRQIVVFRRDKDWRLMAIKLDLAGGLFGKKPLPSDEIWLRDSDIILVPKRPILRLADAVELYFTRSLYGIFPSELGVFDAQQIGGL